MHELRVVNYGEWTQDPFLYFTYVKFRDRIKLSIPCKIIKILYMQTKCYVGNNLISLTFFISLRNSYG